RSARLLRAARRHRAGLLVARAADVRGRRRLARLRRRRGGRHRRPVQAAMSGHFGIRMALAVLAIVAAEPAHAADRPEAEAPPARAQASTAARYDARATTNNLCGITMTNYGF